MEGGNGMRTEKANQKPETRNQKPKTGVVAIPFFWFLVSGFWFAFLFRH
jgi:hypothetical protein